jgi:hypothetical protein
VDEDEACVLVNTPEANGIPKFLSDSTNTADSPLSGAHAGKKKSLAERAWFVSERKGRRCMPLRPTCGPYVPGARGWAGQARGRKEYWAEAED